ncbi:hypothetical protein AB0D46_34740 [Streptomyces sp. NPDC048383]|uniref:hypothetical protein n=1 Tax=Streptomyces sp. NPDC048383 TaxID=3155386 RepID=UPI00341B2B84
MPRTSPSGSDRTRAAALIHPDIPHLPYGRRYDIGWLRCETSTILGTWHPATGCSPTPQPASSFTTTSA